MIKFILLHVLHKYQIYPNTCQPLQSTKYRSRSRPRPRSRSLALSLSLLPPPLGYLSLLIVQKEKERKRAAEGVDFCNPPMHPLIVEPMII
jgi:hypothetical protein